MIQFNDFTFNENTLTFLAMEESGGRTKIYFRDAHSENSSPVFWVTSSLTQTEILDKLNELKGQENNPLKVVVL